MKSVCWISAWPLGAGAKLRNDYWADKAGQLKGGDE